MITLEFIGQRIQQLQVELSMLRSTHDQEVSKFQQTQQQFQEQIDLNQKRFQQLSGAIAELRKLEQNIEQKKENQNDNIPIIADIGRRLAHVHTGVQSQDS
jgi:chromosome segregation ATPase